MPPLALTPFRVAVALLSGLFLTMLIAVTAVARRNSYGASWLIEGSPRRATPSERSLWERHFPSDPLTDEVHCWNGWCVGYEIDRLYRNYVGGVVSHRAGWPLRAFCGERWDDRGAFGGVAGTSALCDLPALGDFDLPLRPAAFGLIVDSTVFGAFTLLVHYVAVLRIARHRQSRGRCGGCNHVILTSGTCQECGLATNQRPFRLGATKNTA